MANTCISFPNICETTEGSIFPTIDTILPSFTAAFRIPPQLLALRGIDPQSLVPNIPSLPTIPAPPFAFPTMNMPSIEQAYAATGTQMTLVLMIVNELITQLKGTDTGAGFIPDIPMPPIPGLPAFGFDDLLAFDPTAMLASLRGAFDPQKLVDLKGQIPATVTDFKGEFQSLLPTLPSKPDFNKLLGGSPVVGFQDQFSVDSITSLIALNVPGLPLPLWPSINPSEWAIYATLQHAIANYMAIMTANVTALITLFVGLLEDAEVPGIPAGPTFPTSFPEVAALMPPGIVPDVVNPEFQVTYTQLAAKVSQEGLIIQALTEYVQSLPVISTVIPSMCDVLGQLVVIPDFCVEVPDLTILPPGGFDTLDLSIPSIPAIPKPGFPIEFPEVPEL